MIFRRSVFLFVLTLFCVPINLAAGNGPVWPCSAQIALLPPSAKWVGDADEKADTITTIRSLVFPGFQLQGIASGKEIAPTLMNFDPLYEAKLAGRLAFFESKLANPKTRDQVILVVDENMGDLKQLHPTQQYFMELASYKPNYIWSEAQHEYLARVKPTRIAMASFMGISALLQSGVMYGSMSIGDHFLSAGVHLGVAWLMDKWMRSVSEICIYGIGFEERIRRYDSAVALDHQLLRFSASRQWAYLSINMGPERKWDLFSHRQPATASNPTPKLTVVLLGYGPAN